MRFKQTRSRLYYKRRAIPYFLLAPVVLFILLFMLWPMVNVFVMSVQNYQLLRSLVRDFIGLDHSITLCMEDECVLLDLLASFVWGVFGVSALMLRGF